MPESPFDYAERYPESEENPFGSAEAIVEAVVADTREAWGGYYREDSQATSAEEAAERLKGLGYTEEDFKTVLMNGGGSHSVRMLSIIALSGEPQVEWQVSTQLKALEAWGEHNGWYHGLSGMTGRYSAR